METFELQYRLYDYPDGMIIPYVMFRVQADTLQQATVKGDEVIRKFIHSRYNSESRMELRTIQRVEKATYRRD